MLWKIMMPAGGYLTFVYQNTDEGSWLWSCKILKSSKKNNPWHNKEWKEIAELLIKYSVLEESK